MPSLRPVLIQVFFQASSPLPLAAGSFTNTKALSPLALKLTMLSGTLNTLSRRSSSISALAL